MTENQCTYSYIYMYIYIYLYIYIHILIDIDTDMHNYAAPSSQDQPDRSKAFQCIDNLPKR